VAKRCVWELGWGIGEAIWAVDVRIENSGSVEEFERKESELLEGYRKEL